MKKILLFVVVISMLTSCGQPLEHEGKTYPTYGFLNKSTDKSKKICYKVSVGNIVWSILSVETVVLPIYFVGFSLFNPVYPKGRDGECTIDRN